MTGIFAFFKYCGILVENAIIPLMTIDFTLESVICSEMLSKDKFLTTFVVAI